MTNNNIRLIARERHNFESQPDTMLLSKSVGRTFNYVKAYVIFGLFGHIFILVCVPTACILVSLTSLALAATAVIWMPIAVILAHFLVLLFFDYHRQKLVDGILFHLIFNVAFMGVVQPIVCLLTATVICPILALITAIWAYLRWSLRQLWDAITYAIIIKRLARVPASESFLARRIAGPGMASK